MRTLILAAAPAALLALAAAAPGPASAGPLRLEEGRLAGVAAGQVDVVVPVTPATPTAPDFSASMSEVTSNNSSATSSLSTAVNQGLTSFSTNDNTAISLSANGVNASGGAITTVMGSITQ